MKTKKFDKKLSLNKKTVSNLSSNQMKSAYGGYETFERTYCRTDCATNCVTMCSACVMTCLICE